MRVRFWGTRGSTPVSLGPAAVAEKLRRAGAALAGRTDAAAMAALPFHLRATYGGNTACVVAEVGGDRIILDAGTGLRELGRQLVRRPPATHHLLLSHTHWDHIIGLPFFAPLYEPGHRVVVHGCHRELAARVAAAYRPEHFPVRLAQLPAQIEFVRLRPGRTAAIAGFAVTPIIQRHPGASYGYRLERDGKALVYSTDSEHKGADDPRLAKFAAFCAGADLLVFDAMYPDAEAATVRRGWGHSSDIAGIRIAKRAGVRHLCLFHHDPDLDDAGLDERYAEALRYRDSYRPEVPLALSMAYDGLELEA